MEQPLDERNFDRFGIQTWIDRKWHVEIWDLTQISFPALIEDLTKSDYTSKDFIELYLITSMKQLRTRSIESGHVDCYVDFMGWSYSSIYAKALLKRMKAIRLELSTGCIPSKFDSKQDNLLATNIGLIQKIAFKSFKSLFGSLFYKIAAYLLRPELYVASGEVSLRSVGHAKSMIVAHNLDYDVFLKLNRSDHITSIGSCVFVDQNICFHRDFIGLRRTPPATPEKYFPTIRRALLKVSDVLKAPVCIAAHPRASHCESENNDYVDIPIRCSETAELIKSCSVVIGHYSTALQFAVMFGKPIIFLTTDELEASGYGEIITAFALELGKSVINVDQFLGEIDWQKELNINYEQYNNYKQKYIKMTGSPEEPYWEIIINEIDKRLH